MGSKRVLARKKGGPAHFFQNIAFYIPGVPLRNSGIFLFGLQKFYFSKQGEKIFRWDW